MAEPNPIRNRLSESQSQVVNWDDGAALVFAGPGVSKTSVLTARIARILESTPREPFRVLTLTNTNKAGDDIRDGVEQLAPALVDRTVIGTFQSICERLLRLHSIYTDFKFDFRLYNQDSYRKQLFMDALRSRSARDADVSQDDVRWLRMIDKFRKDLISPEDVPRNFSDCHTGEHVARVYRVYEDALREYNVMDFDGMILNIYRLVTKIPALAHRIQRVYLYWMIDEFQYITLAQFKLICSLAQSNFKNVLAVVDDDQINYQWEGPSYQRILDFRNEFAPRLIQVVENLRCPAEIVEASNNLISHGFHQTNAQLAFAAVPSRNRSSIKTRCFATDQEEVQSIVQTLARRCEASGSTAILAHQKRMLSSVKDGLDAVDVKSYLVVRRDEFSSPQFVWLESCLQLCVRQMDQRAFASLVAAGNRIARGDSECDPDAVGIEAVAIGRGYLELWADLVPRSGDSAMVQLSHFAKHLIESRRNWREVVDEVVEWIPDTVPSDGEGRCDIDEDLSAWRNAESEFRREFGSRIELDEFLQWISLTPKELSPEPDSVCLCTIRGSKGLEFDNVWVMGVADSILPSWQSLRRDARPIELEEERRNFFVAITRTRKRLVLSYANQYGGRARDASRFLRELEIRHPHG